MEIAKKEVIAIQEAIAKVEKDVIELQDLELSLVGGGSGDVAFG